MSGDDRKPGEIISRTVRWSENGVPRDNNSSTFIVDPSATVMKEVEFAEVKVPGGLLSGVQNTTVEHVDQGVYTTEPRKVKTSSQNTFQLTFTPTTLTRSGTIIKGEPHNVVIRKGEDSVNAGGRLPENTHWSDDGYTLENPKLHQDIALAWDKAKVKQKNETVATITPDEARALAGLVHKATDQVCKVVPYFCPNAKGGKGGGRGGRGGDDD